MATTPGNIGAIAFSRTGDPDNGDFFKGVMLSSFGEVDLDLALRWLPSVRPGRDAGRAVRVSA